MKIGERKPKPVYSSKAGIAGVLTMLISILTLISTYLETGTLDMVSFTTLMTGLGIVGIRDAI